MPNLLHTLLLILFIPIHGRQNEEGGDKDLSPNLLDVKAYALKIWIISVKEEQ